MTFGEKQGVILCSKELGDYRPDNYYELYYYHDQYVWQKLPAITSYLDWDTVLSIPEGMTKCESFNSTTTSTSTTTITSPTTTTSTSTPSKMPTITPNTTVTYPYVTLNTTTITTNEPPIYLYLEIGIPVAIVSVIVMTISIYFLCFYHKRKHSNNEEFVLQNIFNLRNPPKFDHLSQKMFDDEIAMLEQVDGKQITKGNQIGK